MTSKFPPIKNGYEMNQSVNSNQSKPFCMEEIIDFTKRFVPEVTLPKTKQFLSENTLFDKNRHPNIENLRNHFTHEGRLEKKHVMEILKMTQILLKAEPNLLQLSEPCTVVGDIHGQYYDLLKLIDSVGTPSKNQYLFLGDYVDRGCFGIECILLLFSYKIHFPETFKLLRGNHECRHLTAYFNFKSECEYKYDLEVYEEVMITFDCLPLCALLNGKFFCVHGGLSPDIVSLDDVMDIDRFQEIPAVGAFCDLLWSDPLAESEDIVDEDSMFQFNELRGCSYNYSYLAVSIFLKTNNLLSVIRAHEAQDTGYRLYKNDPHTQFPSIICIFSAPNYCDTYKNKGAIIKFENNTMNVKQFTQAPHPYHLPNFINVFEWSLPFIGEKCTSIVEGAYQVAYEPEQEEVISKDRQNIIGAKIIVLGRIARMMSTLQEQQEHVTRLKDLNKGLIPQGLLLQGPQAIKDAITSFEVAKQLDAASEKRPEKTGEVIKIRRKSSFAQQPVNVVQEKRRRNTVMTIGKIMAPKILLDEKKDL
jgi:serine/threonine-protein phosphatase 2B catalytic subunit